MFVNILTSAASWDSEHQLLTYLVPAKLEDSIRVGQLVAVPYGERLVEGLIWDLYEEQLELDPAHTLDPPPETQVHHTRYLSPSVGAQLIAPESPNAPAEPTNSH